MSTKSVVTKYGLIAGVSAVTAAGVLANPLPGHAAPGDCIQYGWPERYQLIADNGLVIEGTGPLGGGKTAIGFAIAGLSPGMAIIMNPGLRMQGSLTIEGKQISGSTADANSAEEIFVINGEVGRDGVGRGTIFADTDPDGFDDAATRFHTDHPLPCLRTEQAVQPAPPPPAPPPVEEEKLLQGPVVTPREELTGVTFTVTDRSGVASQCTYSSEGFNKSFGLPANGTVDVFVPAIRQFRERTGTITCDNGTSANTSVFY